MLDDYDLLKKNKLEEINTKIKDLYKFVEYTDSPKLVDLNIAKLLYDNNIVTFIDARDLSDYKKGHIKGAISLASCSPSTVSLGINFFLADLNVKPFPK